MACLDSLHQLVGGMSDTLENGVELPVFHSLTRIAAPPFPDGNNQ